MLSPRAQAVVRLLLYAYAAGIIAYIFLSYWGPATWPDSRLNDMIVGISPKPYVTRRLIPDLLALFAQNWPPAWNQWLLQVYGPGTFFPYYHAAEQYLGIYLIYCVLVWLCLFGHAAAIHGLARDIYPDYPPVLAALAPLLSLLMLPICFRYYNYCYDPATILLATLAPLYLIRRRWLYYSLTFFAACFNKETAILLAVFFAIANWNTLPRRTLVLGTVAQVAAWAVIRGAIAFRFRYTPSHPQFHLFEHNLSLVHTPQFVYLAVVLAVLTPLIAMDWRRKPAILRVGLLVNLLPLAGAGLFVGFIDELRDYYEAWPFVVLLALPGLAAAVGVARRSAEPLG